MGIGANTARVATAASSSDEVKSFANAPAAIIDQPSKVDKTGSISTNRETTYRTQRITCVPLETRQLAQRLFSYAIEDSDNNNSLYDPRPMTFLATTLDKCAISGRGAENFVASTGGIAIGYFYISSIESRGLCNKRTKFK